jgi:hypothetical protein
VLGIACSFRASALRLPLPALLGRNRPPIRPATIVKNRPNAPPARPSSVVLWCGSPAESHSSQKLPARSASKVSCWLVLCCPQPGATREAYPRRPDANWRTTCASSFQTFNVLPFVLFTHCRLRPFQLCAVAPDCHGSRTARTGRISCFLLLLPFPLWLLPVMSRSSCGGTLYNLLIMSARLLVLPPHLMFPSCSSWAQQLP